MTTVYGLHITIWRYNCNTQVGCYNDQKQQVLPYFYINCRQETQSTLLKLVYEYTCLHQMMKHIKKSYCTIWNATYCGNDIYQLLPTTKDMFLQTKTSHVPYLHSAFTLCAKTRQKKCHTFFSCQYKCTAMLHIYEDFLNFINDILTKYNTRKNCWKILYFTDYIHHNLLKC